MFYVTNISLQNPIILFDFLFCLEILCTAFIRFDSNSYFLEVIYLRQKSTKTWGYIITMLYCPMLFFAFHTCKRFTVLCICLYTRFYKQSPMRHLSLIYKIQPTNIDFNWIWYNFQSWTENTSKSNTRLTGLCHYQIYIQKIIKGKIGILMSDFLCRA